MESLEKGGANGVLEHFYSILHKEAFQLPTKVRRSPDIKSLSSKAIKWKAAYDSRQVFQKGQSVQEKSSMLEISMRSEHLIEGVSGCQCRQCLTGRLKIPQKSVGFLYSAGIEESFEKHFKLAENFSMIYVCYRNMLSMIDSAFVGVSFPNLYVGMSHSHFPLHVEDASLW